MNRLPEVVSVRVHSGKRVFGSFIDPEWVVHYIAAGSWVFRMEGRRYRVDRGDMVLLPPGVLHVVRPLGAGRLVQHVVHFNLSGGGLPRAFPYAVFLPPSAREKVQLLFRELREEWDAGLACRETVQAGLLAAMLGIYRRHAGKERTSEREEAGGWQHAEAAIQFLHRNHARPGLTLGEIGAASGLSRNHFCRVFKGNTGHSAMAYLDLLRLQKAEELLLRSSLNCSQVAEAVGYTGIHAFSRAFRRSRGFSPTVFRARHAPRGAV